MWVSEKEVDILRDRIRILEGQVGGLNRAINTLQPQTKYLLDQTDGMVKIFNLLTEHLGVELKSQETVPMRFVKRKKQTNNRR